MGSNTIEGSLKILIEAKAEEIGKLDENKMDGRMVG